MFVSSTLAEPTGARSSERPFSRERPTDSDDGPGFACRGSARPEAERVAQIREALGADRFDEVFAAGAALSQQDAVIAARRRHGEGVRAS